MFIEEEATQEESLSLFKRFIRKYGKGEAIFRQGEERKELYLIHSGRVQIVKETTPGQGITIDQLEPGDVLGEMVLLEESSVHTTSAIADEGDTQVIVLDRVRFTYLVQQMPDFVLQVLKTVEKRLERMAEERRGAHG